MLTTKNSLRSNSNTYSLMTTRAISDGLRLEYPDEQGARVFSLTRSSFAGQQRTGATLWSGDTSGMWDSLRRQVAASLNYAMSGMPYWSEDIGGFFRPSDQYTSRDYRHLLCRWFQFGVFTPIYRVHGGGSHTEIWNYGNDVEAILNATNNLRYRMLPYIYSGFHRVETEGYTMQRSLPFDFPDDLHARDVATQFMWGSSFMVAPVVDASSDADESRELYVPRSSSSWVDFWTGAILANASRAGETLRVDAPLDRVPLLVRTPSVVVLADFSQYATEKKWDPLEVRLYVDDEDAGRASFVLYEDDGTSRDYRTQGRFTTIPITFDVKSKTLTMGDREGGGFATMLVRRTVHVVLVRTGKGDGLMPCFAKQACDKTFLYEGKSVSVKL